MVNEERAKSTTELTEQSRKTISLFQFVRELNKIKQKLILNLDAYPWTFAVSDLPNDPENIKFFYRDRVEDEMNNDNGGDNVLLSVHKPESRRCPMPAPDIRKWLLPGWDDYRNEPQVKDFIELQPEEQESELDSVDENPEDAEKELPREYFADNSQRVQHFDAWRAIRSDWVAKQKITEETRGLFADLYRYYFELQRESETEEIIVANGVLCDAKKKEIRHPVLTHRVKIEYAVNSDTLRIVDTDTPSELYSAVFQSMEDINLDCVKTLTDDLQKNDYHPLDRNETPVFLKTMARQLSDDSQFSERPITDDGEVQRRLLLYLYPCFIVRKRLDGTVKAIERIIEDIQNTDKVPQPIGDIVSGGTIDIDEDTGEVPIEERLAAVGGESVDILLSKEANKEQLDIAKRIEHFNAVLVQGPPGTGKTHTIANLMGHLLAQGKSVLVTSYTKKALSVLKEKVVPGLRDLCVSMLDDSNVDMERSVDGITNHLSSTNSHELKREMDKLSTERRDVIKKLADVRKKIYAVINQECSSIVLNGESISPSAAAAYVVEHAEDLSYIPGKVRMGAPLPLSFEQLTDLYRSNESVTAADEKELETALPDPKTIMTPGAFSDAWDQYQSALKQIENIKNENGWDIEINDTERSIAVSGSFGKFSIPYPIADAIGELKRYALSFGKIERWMKAVAVDGKRGNSYRQQWRGLIDAINKACICSEEFVSLKLGKQLTIRDGVSMDVVKAAFSEMRPIFVAKGKIGKLVLWRHNEYKQALESVSINGNAPASAEDCDLILKYIELQELREKCRGVWNYLLTPHEAPSFDELDRETPERIASNWIPLIEKYLNWYAADYGSLLEKLNAVDIPSDILFQKDIRDSELVEIEKILTCIEDIIPEICDICIFVNKSQTLRSTFSALKKKLISGKRGSSRICKALVNAINKGDTSAYAETYADLEKMYEKYELQRNRNDALKVFEPVAPEWAEAIRTRRGIHGGCVIPSNIDDAWKWKQLSEIVEEITRIPLGDLQAESLRLSRDYREVTAEYAEKSGWYYLLHRTETNINMKQALEGWRQTVKSIGKGTGKKAPMLKAKARQLMSQCQKAVPCWIMPINKALESLDPRVNKFDVIIIDEASQSDVSSLAILYMGKKLIIVGDDKQVSPMAVGVDDRRILSLQDQFIRDKIPNAHLYSAKTSIYDIAKTTFQPLMLREHFRCVPEIIGFSNMLSYDGKIKPLRDASSSILLPAVVNYRVTDGRSKGKANPREAETIIALMQACFDQPEYAGKSFGVISMLGDEQVKLIQQQIEKKLKPQDVIDRNILWGNPANFQGDERDVIFLSMVDSGDEDGPLKKREFGPDDTYRKRYNVAVSRARDQIWVVDSLDPANDLKPGDIRKTLIDYSLNPNAIENTHEEIRKKAESPFEISVAEALSDRGYHLEQQWKVGSYRLDMVAVYGKKKVAIECDGERWHSSEEQIREDMERQTILERLGWKFIRIRGSEFYRNQEKTIERIISELTDYGIEPEDISETQNADRETELLKRVKARAAAILDEESTAEPEQDTETIAAALDPNKLAIDREPAAEFVEKPTSVEKPAESEKRETKGTKSDALQPKTAMNSPKADKRSSSEKAERPVTEKKTVSKPAQMRFVFSNAGKGGSALGITGESNDDRDIIAFLRENDVEYIDKREKGGALWIVGGNEMQKIVETCEEFGVHFEFKKNGGKATKNRDGWWAK